MITGIIGPDGSGKTTMCRRLAGMLPAKDGIGRSADRIGYISPTAEFTPKTIETDELRPTLVYETRVYVNDPEGILKLGAPVVVELE